MFETKRYFNLDDQIAFAEISGDYNPIHLDDLIARRSIFGETIVHGMHLILWVLNEHTKIINNRSFGPPLDNEILDSDLSRSGMFCNLS